MKEIVIDNQMGDAATAAVACESRREAAKLQNVGKHEPKGGADDFLDRA